MNDEPRPTPNELREWFSYDPQTGDVRWVKRNGKRGKVGDIAGNIMNKGYRNVYLKGFTLKAHIVAFAIHHGRFPTGIIDHINGDKADNRIENLREATINQNSYNAKRPSHNTSGTKGVFFHARSQKWTAQITVDGRQKTVGRFASIEDAISARREASENLHKEFARHE